MEHISHFPFQLCKKSGCFYGLLWQAIQDSYANLFSWTVLPQFAYRAITDTLKTESPMAKRIVDPFAGSSFHMCMMKQISNFEVYANKSTSIKGAKVSWPIQVHQIDPLDTEFQLDDILWLSWIPDQSTLGTQLLHVFPGEICVYIGEDKGGCCGSDCLFEELDQNWQELKKISIPVFPGFCDAITVYKRKQ